MRDDLEASGKSYVGSNNAWNPLLRAELPAQMKTEKDVHITVWVRTKGQFVCLKSEDDAGKHQEIQWLFKNPSNWTWNTVGTFPLEDLGKHMVFIGPDKGNGPQRGLDAVFLATSSKHIPPGINKTANLDGMANEEHAAI